MSYNLHKIAGIIQNIMNNTKEGMVGSEGYQCVKTLSGAGSTIRIKGEGIDFTGKMPDDAPPAVSIVNEGCDALTDVVREVLQDPQLREKVGQKAVEEQIANFVQKHFGKPLAGEMAEVIKEEILKPLRSDIRPWNFIVPVVNLVVKTPLAIGPIRFVPEVTPIVDATRFLMDHTFGGSPFSQELSCATMLKVIYNATNMSPAFAYVRIDAHPKHCEIRGCAVAELGINLLRSFTHVFYNHDQLVRFGLPSEVQNGLWWSLSLGLDEKHMFQAATAQRGTLFQFELDESKIDHLNKNCAFEEGVNILSRDPNDWNTFETAIIRSIQALGRSVVSHNHDQSFLGCTTAIERILIPDGCETTVERFSDRLALLIGAGKENRLWISQTAKRLYDVRSQIVHAAVAGVTEEDYSMMEKFALRSIIMALGMRKDFKNHDVFCSEINARKFE